MQLCGCLPVGNNDAREKKKQSSKRYSLKRGMFINISVQLILIFE